MKTAVTTRGYDFVRSGVNANESVLTAQAVGTHGIKKLFTLNTPDDARGCEASPLIAPGVKLANGQVHDLAILCTMGNWIYAYDSNDGALVWKRHLGKPIKGTQKIDQHKINQFWGILSTPVIRDGTLYGCTWISADGTPEKGKHFAFAVDLKTGNDVHPLLDLEDATYDPGHGIDPIRFRSAQRKQRSALALTQGALIIPFGTIAETARSARGFMIAVDLGTWKIAATWCSTARGSGAGVWMAGHGPSVLPNGDLAFFTGNGTFDGELDFGESLVRLRFTPAKGNTKAHFNVVDWWTPWTDAGRTGGHAKEENDDEAAPTNFRPINALAREWKLNLAMATGEWSDMDLGSGGVCYVPAFDMLVGAGKDGVLYAANAKNLGKTRPKELEPNTNQANYGKLAFRPIFFTYYPADLDPAPKHIETLNTVYYGRTHHQHGGPISYDSPEFGPMLFNWGENENGRAWQLTAGKCKYLARSAESASPEAPLPGGGMPGAMLSLTCNGKEPGTAVLWATIPYDDANTKLSAGRLVAYAATQFHDGFMKKLWDSQDWAHQFTYNKFNPPVVANGKLFLPTYDGKVIVYGLA